MIKKLYARFDEDGNVLCLCNKDCRKCDPNIPEDCKEYMAKFTEIGKVDKRKMSQSPRKFGTDRTLSGELKPEKIKGHKKSKIENLLKKD